MSRHPERSPSLRSSLGAAAQDDAFLADAIARHTRFVTEVIEAGNFCPWARTSRLKGRTAVQACYERDLAEVARTLLVHASPSVDVLQIVVPDGASNAMRWRETVAELEKALRRVEPALPWAFAAFHPTHPGRPESIGGTIGLLRRSPYPAVQCIRLAALDAVRDDDAAVGDAVAERNQRVMLQKWSEHWVYVLLATHPEDVPDT